nr:MAG TPA: hypothetical protein [Caudoviricetes sp.]DAL68998.1 MAG TPA: hypothetical protein [Caudoviricetes sp.]DAU87833.1 MAG TPA: hypothetical protein [Caudoviricetes sp.]
MELVANQQKLLAEVLRHFCFFAEVLFFWQVQA